VIGSFTHPCAAAIMNSGDEATFASGHERYVARGAFTAFEEAVTKRVMTNRAGRSINPSLVMAADPVISEHFYKHARARAGTEEAWPSFLSGAVGCEAREVNITPVDAGKSGLIAGTHKVLAWNAKFRRSLTYYVEPTNSPAGPAVDSAGVIAAFVEEAGNAWGVTCGVRFRRVSAERDAVFIVRAEKKESRPGVLAEACFPHTHHDNRYLLIYPKLLQYMTSESDAEYAKSVFLHELGHVLGMRHEYLRDGSTATDTEATLAMLSEDDPASAMRTPCEGREISATDRAVMERVYPRR